MSTLKTEVIYGGDIEVTFIEDKEVWPEVHEYQVRFKKGERWTEPQKVDISVSGITNVLDKPKLVGWATKMCAEFVQMNYPRLSEKVVVNTLTGLAVDEVELGAFIQDMKSHGKGRKKEAATIGVMAHAWIESHIKHVLGLGPKPSPVVNSAVNNAIEAFLKWEKEHHVVYIATERMVYSKRYAFAGQIDIEAKVDFELAILDNKTSSGIYPEMEYQLAGYQLAAEEEALYTKEPVRYDARWILRLDKVTGEFEAKRYIDHETAKAGFLACYTLARQAFDRKAVREAVKAEQKAVRAKNGPKTGKAKAPRTKKAKVAKAPDAPVLPY